MTDEQIDVAVERVGVVIDRESGVGIMSQEEARDFYERIMHRCRDSINAITSDIGDGDEYPDYKI